MRHLNYMLLVLMFAKVSIAFATVPAEVFNITSEDNLALDSNGSPQKTVYISNSINDGLIGIFNKVNKRKFHQNIFGADYMENYDRAKLRCDGTSSKTISLYHNSLTKLRIKKGIKICDLIIDDSRYIRLVNDQLAFPFLKKLHDYQETCNYEIPKEVNSDQIFLTSSYKNMGCAHSAKKIEVLDDSKNALLVKIETLLGKKLPVSFINEQNPYASLDFSNAPKLDAIFVSTLLYRHDFSGIVLARLLKHHAQNGTMVNIIGTGYMQGDKDKALLNELRNASPNIRIQEYKYHEANIFKKAKILTNFLRDHHIKMFVTLSSQKEEDNILIIGGRNVHDGFVFQEKPNFSQFPEMNQVDQDADYAYWKDLEIKVTSKALAKSVYAQLLKFWNRKIKNQKMEPINITSASDPQIAAKDVLNLSENTHLIRHIVSLPFNDDSALEKLYVEMIDRAQKSIKLSSPYLRPTKGIMKAIERALIRNPEMDITIQTRINLAGDTQAWLYEETNKKAINDLYDKVKIYEWKEDSILHTKLLIVDDHFVFIGSVNLSQRSFIQDTESGFLVNSKEFADEMIELFDSYNQKSERIVEAQKRRFWGSIISTIFKSQF